MMESDDFADALRRELAGVTVAHDADGADAMIRTAAAADPLGARSWQAPLAAATVVVVVGGGAAAIAATHSTGGSPSGGPAVCVSDAPPTPASPASTPAPSTSPAPSTASAPSTSPAPPPTSTAVPMLTETAAATGTDGPVVVSLPPVAGAPARTPQELPTRAPSTSAVPATPTRTTATTPTPTGPETTDPTPVPSSSAAAPSNEPCSPTPIPPAPTTFVISALPGETASRTIAAPATAPIAFELHRESGESGTLRFFGAAGPSFAQTLAELDSLPRVTFAPSVSQRLELRCTGTTTCSVRVTLDDLTTLGSPAVTMTGTPSR